MNKLKGIIITLFSSLVTLTSCFENDSTPSISVGELFNSMSDSTLVILDVRTLGELEGSLGKIDGAIHIPLKELDARISELKPFSKKKIAVICRSGSRSKSGTKILLEAGYNALNVKGGMIAFRNQESTK